MEPIIPFKIDEIVYYEILLIVISSLTYFFVCNGTNDFSAKMSLLDCVHYSIDVSSGVGNSPVTAISERAKMLVSIQILAQFFVLIPMISYGLSLRDQE